MKKIVCLILVILCITNMTICAATFSDVKEDSPYYEAVEELSKLGIVAGYNGKFNPENVITRAEVVAIINRLQGLSEAAKVAAGTSMYADVAKTDWFAGDVNLASQMGIVSGNGDGTFRPNDIVKFEEAVKLMVAVLGYSYNDALKKGGWPTGYLIIAKDEGIINDADLQAATANRGIVAQMADKVYKRLNHKQVEKPVDKEDVPASPSETYEIIEGITTKSAFIKYQGKKLQNEFKYDNDIYTLEYEAILNYIKKDADRTAVVKLVATNAYDRTNTKETEVEITIPANTDEYNFVHQFDFKKTAWFNIVGNDLLNKKDSDLLFTLYVNNEKVNEFKKTFSYQYSAEKSVADTFKIYDAQMETLNSKDEVVQKGNQLVKYANAARIRFLSNVSVDKSSEEENIDIFHIDVKIYENFRYNKETDKISGGLVSSWYGFCFCPAVEDKFGFTYGGEYRVGTFRTGKYTMVFSLYDEIIYTYDFEVINP